LSLVLPIVALTIGCAAESERDDAGMGAADTGSDVAAADVGPDDTSPVDAEPLDAEPTDAIDSGDIVDAFDALDADDADIGDDVPSPSGPRILREGTAGYLIRGDLLLPDRVLEDGEVLFVDDRIVCVDVSCADAQGASDATWIETDGIVSPGLIDAHNHLPYNFLPEWVPDDGRLFDNRYQWADDPSYENHVLPLTAYRSSNSHFCPAAEWGELRSLLHGTTTIQGQSFDRNCIDGLVRNADHTHGLGPDHMRTTIGSPRDITDSDADGYIESFADDVTRFAVHMQEGLTGNNILEEHESFAGRDDRSNRHAGLSLLGETSILIHAISLTLEQLDEVSDTGAQIVWSPSSNLVLYGQTLDIEAVVMRGIPVGIGPDWTLSGEDDLLGEFAVALQYAADNAIDAVDAELLWRMATDDGAHVIGLREEVGALEPGLAADVVLFAPGATPWRAVTQARATDVQLVFVDGSPLYGLSTFEPPGDDCEPIDVCGDARFVCRSSNSAFDSVGAIEQALVDILEGTGFGPDEQYGRGDELLPLVDCRR
jgi:cytosine/adenosine deaminase-related metal-dependent hydrolase